MPNLNFLTEMPKEVLFLNILAYLCTVSVLTAVLIDFLSYHKRVAQKEKKSVVETFTMICFFLVYYLFVRFELFRISVDNLLSIRILAYVGAVLMVAGAIFNIWGRICLGKNWSNQIKVYKDHAIVSKGAYHFVRHPLYASLIWMFIGGSMIYRNIGALVLTIVIFIPFMKYRANQEEMFLSKEFTQYQLYKDKTGMFLPKFWRIK